MDKRIIVIFSTGEEQTFYGELTREQNMFIIKMIIKYSDHAEEEIVYIPYEGVSYLKVSSNI